MSKHARLRFITLTVLAAMQFGAPVFARAPSGAAASAPPAAAAQPGTFAAIRHIDAGDLNVGYVDAGPADGPVVILLHGWPYDIHSYVDVVPILTQAGYRVTRCATASRRRSRPTRSR